MQHVLYAYTRFILNKKKNQSAIPINRTMDYKTRNNFFTESRKEHFSGISSSDQKCMVEMHYKFHGDMFIHVGDNHSLM